MIESRMGTFGSAQHGRLTEATLGDPPRARWILQVGIGLEARYAGVELLNSAKTRKMTAGHGP